MDLSLHVTSDGSTVVGSILRSTQAYLELLSAKTTLDWGIAFYGEKFPGLHSGNQFREVWIESAEQAAEALASTEAFFAQHGLTCTKWALAEAQSPEVLEPVLTAAGFDGRDILAMALAAWPEIPVPEGVRVLPARPMRAAFRAVWEQAAAFLPTAADRETFVEAANERLDDHRMDAFVALVEEAPAGVVALFQVGDIGRVVDLHVVEEHRRRGIGSALINHVIEMARRLTMRTVCTAVNSRNAGGIAFLKRIGLVEAGHIREYHRAGTPQPVHET